MEIKMHRPLDSTSGRVDTPTNNILAAGDNCSILA